MNNSELVHLVALSQAVGIGPHLSKSLIAYCGGTEAVFKTPIAKLRQIPGVGKAAISTLQDKALLKQAESEMDYAAKQSIELVTFLDKDYPRRLKSCADAPILLFKKGKLDLNPSAIIAIIGTRRASNYGKAICKEIVRDLQQVGVTIVSGLALGIDGAAHKQAIESNLPTIGVLGGNLESIYPHQHKDLAQEMTEKGALLTESGMEASLVPGNFPRRNRIIAGMCDALLVVESGLSGGAMITANIANSYNRDVFAVPGRAKDRFSAGCNNLIKTHRAALIESADDIMQAMNWKSESTGQKAGVQSTMAFDLDEFQAQIVECLEQEERTVDELSLAVEKPISQVTTNLLQLELMGLVRCLPGSVYVKN